MTRQHRLSSPLICGIAVLLGLAGCGGVGGGPSSEPSRLETFGFSLPDEIATTRVDVFKKQHPDVDLDIVEGAFDEQQFLSAVASKEPSDLVYLDRNLVGTYAARGAIVPLDDCVADHDIDMGQYRDAARRQVTIGGAVYGIPEFYSVRVVIANDAVLRKAGLSPDDVDFSDWDKLADVNRKLAAVNGGKLTRIGIDPKVPEFLPMWAKANGVDLLGADGRTANLDDPKVVEALQRAADLIADQGGWGAFKAFRDTFDMFGAENPVAEGQIGAWPMEDWYINVLAKNTPKAEITVKPFTDRDGDPLTYATGQAWVVPKGARNPDAACRFAKTMTAPDTWVAAAKERKQTREAEGEPFTGLYTGNRKADAEIFDSVYEPSGNPRFDKAVEVVLAVQSAAFSLPPSPAAAEFDKIRTDAVNRALTGRQSPAEALAAAQRDAEAAFKRAAD